MNLQMHPRTEEIKYNHEYSATEQNELYSIKTTVHKFNIGVNFQIHLNLASIQGKYAYVDMLVRRKPRDR